MWFAPLV